MISIKKENFNRAIIALIFSIITISTLSFLSFKTPYGIFLAGSFGSSMVLLFGYPESPFAQPKNVFFGHLLTSLTGVLILKFFPIDQFLQIGVAVGLGIFVMILFGVSDATFSISMPPSVLLIKAIFEVSLSIRQDK